LTLLHESGGFKVEWFSELGVLPVFLVAELQRFVDYAAEAESGAFTNQLAAVTEVVISRFWTLSENVL
jgi:hypothetical protein